MSCAARIASYRLGWNSSIPERAFRRIGRTRLWEYRYDMFCHPLVLPVQEARPAPLR
jgi:hypothetical protein